MLSDDRAFLESRGWRFEVVPEDQMISLVIVDYPLPPGYTPEKVDLLLRLPVGFPDAAPDMFWTDPVVAYVGGGVPPATEVRETHLDRIWQRWSRHLAVAWRPGIDNLQNYMRLIRTDLESATSAQAA